MSTHHAKNSSQTSLKLPQLTKREITPLRNANIRKGQVALGDRYICTRSEQQMNLANHLLTNADKEREREALQQSSGVGLELVSIGT